MTIVSRAASTVLYRTANVLYGTARFISRIATRLTTAGEKVSGTYYLGEPDENGNYDIPF